LKERRVSVFLHLEQVRNFEHAFAAAETFADSLAFGIGIGHEISGLDLSELCIGGTFQYPQRAWRLATTSVGGRLRIARNPYQGFSAVGSENTGKKTVEIYFPVFIFWRLKRQCLKTLH
jgi:hypothetical protein